MTHVVFVDVNRSGVRGLEVALERGYRVSLIRCVAFSGFHGGARTQAVIAELNRVVDITDSSNPDCVAEGIARIQAEEPIDAVICVAHWAVYATALAARRLGLRFTEPEAIRRAYDKLLCRQTLESYGVPSTRYAEVANAEEALERAADFGYPVILKPATGYGSLLSKMADTSEEVRRYFEGYEDAVSKIDPIVRRDVVGKLIMEQRLIGELFSVEIGVTKTQIILPFMIDQRKRTDHDEIIELGSSVPPDLSNAEQQRMIDYTTQVIHALGLDLGIFHIEIIETEEGPRLVDANPRLMGGNLPELFHSSTGLDIFDFLLDIHLGRNLERTRFVPVRAATSRTIAAKAAGRVATGLEDDWLEEFRPRMEICQINVTPGQEVGAVADNFSTLGFFQVTGSSYRETVEAADNLVREIGERLGIDVAL